MKYFSNSKREIKTEKIYINLREIRKEKKQEKGMGSKHRRILKIYVDYNSINKTHKRKGMHRLYHNSCLRVEWQSTLICTVCT